MNEERFVRFVREMLEKISSKRARMVVAHILEHGSISTQQISEYGYDHPPRAARDVKESGIPLIGRYVQNPDGSRIYIYEFGDFSKLNVDRLSGRAPWPKDFKTALIEKYGAKCNISGAQLEPRALQIDHRVPYEVIGDDAQPDLLNLEDFMLLSGSSNRAKSWSCENCENWRSVKKPATCRTCHWAAPEDYEHVAMQQERRTAIVWQGEETSDYERLKHDSESRSVSLQELIKELIRKHLQN